MKANAYQEIQARVDSGGLDRAKLYPALKRTFDIIFALLGLVIFLPLGIVAGLAIKLGDGGHIFYRQRRIGRFGVPFDILKFRTMRVQADQTGPSVTQESDPRITPVGRVLRKSKLDELPQLWNVLVGEMSFVGPRPEVPRYVAHYTPAQRDILKHKPGITDLASVLFRNEEALLRGAKDVEGFYIRYCLPRKIELNRQYAERASVMQDIWIILQTLCPYWLGVLTIYSLALVASLWFAYELRFDFQVAPREYAEFWRCLPWVVLPQLALLVWRGQFRGLMSYFSIPEMRQITVALGMAFVFHAGLWYTSQGRLAPGRSILVLDFLIAFLALCAVRMSLRAIRERLSGARPKNGARARRIAIIGTGDLGTKLALDLTNDPDAQVQVVAFFDDDPYVWHKRPHDIPVIGMPECLLNLEWREKIDEVIVALPDDKTPRYREIGDMLKGLPLKVTFASTWPVLQPMDA